MKEGLEKDAKKVDSSGVKDGEISTDTGKKKIKEERPPTKVVVRRLPPTMTEEEFLQQIDPVPSVDYMYYVPADMSLSPNSFCRAYLNFINQSDIFIFTQKFDGYVFVDSKGLEYPAVVEFSPFQRIPKQRPGRKKDPKAGTLESDVTYKSFLEKLQAQIQESTTAGSNIKQHFFETNVTVNENKVSTTPLLDYLRSRHAERLRAREEKRKKDLERKRARDEQRRNAKKPEEDSSVVKVLPSQTHSNKDKVKDKDSTKPVKKRIEDRIKETKGRVGKSYSEERQKQIEKREEQRKKYSNISSKSSKSQTDKKSSEQNSVDLEKNSSAESKKIENDTKSVDNENKKDSYGEKKNYQHKYFDSQKHYDYGKRDDEVKRRPRDDRTNKTKDSYRDRREDRFSARKKSDKKTYDRHEDYSKDKYRKEHSYRKESSHNNGADKKSDSEVKKDKTVESITSDPVEKKTCNMDTDSVSADREINLKVDENNRDGSLSIVEPEPKSEGLKGNEVNKNELKNGTKTETYESMKQRRNSLESAGDGLSFFQQERTELIDEIQQTVKVRRSSLESVYDLSCEGFIKKHSDNNVDNSDCGSEKQFSSQIGTAVYVHKQSESDNGSIKTETDGEHDDICRAGDMGIQKSNEVVLKRRNSMEMYDKKDESSEKIREMTRRSSLESGDKNTNCKQLEKKHEGKKRSDEPTKSKLKDPRTERRIRNKDRPSIEIYRPGMGRFSKQRMEREKVLGSSTEVDSNSPSPSPTLVSKNKSTLVIVNQNRDS